MACPKHLFQDRDLKRGLKAPDVYPQDRDQKEDKLNETSLKKGYINTPITSNEGGSARDKVKTKGLAALHQSIMTSTKELTRLKQALNTVTDNSSRKIPTIQRDTFWSVNQRSNRIAIKKFCMDLATVSKPLSQIVKGRIPTFQKKEETLDNMAEHQVPVLRAIWFMKITAVHMNTISKKRNQCSATEWTKCLTEYLRDSLSKFADQPLGNHQDFTKSVMNMGNKAHAETYAAKNRWNYGLRLAHVMYQDGLLDRQEFLLFLIKWIHELKISEADETLKHLVQVMLTYFDDVVENFVLARCAAYMCVTKLNSLSEVNSIPSPYEWDSAVKDCRVPERSACPYHDSLLLIFSTILQRITLECPTALVYQRHWVCPLLPAGGAIDSISKESPLDKLPCYPASLPFPKDLTPAQLEKMRHDISESTEDVRVRSVISEERWLMCEDNSPPSALAMLAALDEHNFYISQTDHSRVGSVASIYKKIFGPISKPLSEQLRDDAPIVSGLCEWAVTHRRTGSHRCLVVAELLKKRQTALLEVQDQRKKKESESIFQEILFRYLNENAPTWTAVEEDRVQFHNMMTLFGELVRSMFSYTKYLNKLISRGDLSSHKLYSAETITTLGPDLQTLPRHRQYVLCLPINDLQKDKHRCSLLFGTPVQGLGVDSSFMTIQKELAAAYQNLGPSNSNPYATLQQCRTVIEGFRQLLPVYKYMITQQLMEPFLPAAQSKFGGGVAVPTVLQMELMYTLMELSGDVRSMMTLSLYRLTGPSVSLNIYLSIIAVLKKYKTCLLISEKDTATVFEALSNLYNESGPVSAAERCILIYRQELYRANTKLATQEPSSPKYPTAVKKRRPNIVKSIAAWSESWLAVVENPRSADLEDVSRRIAEDEVEGQRLVSTIVRHVISGACHLHKLTELVELCAELTTRHPYLEGLWVCAMITPSHCGELPEGTEWWSNFSLFIILLIRFHCTTLWWIVYFVIWPSLCSYTKGKTGQHKWPSNYHVIHLMLALFTEVERPPVEELDKAIVMHSAFRHLDADRRALTPYKFTMVLKLLVVRESTQHIPDTHKHMHLDAVLRTICSQPWVPELCLVTPEKLADNYLVDKELPPESAQLLLNLICDSEADASPSTPLPDLPAISNPTDLIDSILTRIDKWTIRSSYLKIRLLQMLSREQKNEAETLKLVSDAVVTTLSRIISEVARGESKHSTLWLVPAFINKLHDPVKDHLIQWLGEWLGEGSWWESEFTYCTCTDWQQPLLTLMTHCLSNKLQLIIGTLHSQLKKFVDEVRTVDSLTEEQGEQLNTAIHLRISLVGAVFPTITANQTMKLDWGTLLLRLVQHPAVDRTLLGEGVLFYSLLDMLATITESLELQVANTIADDVTSKTMFFKKICNDIWDVSNPVNRQIRQLLRIPLFKHEVTVVEHTAQNVEWQARTPAPHEHQYPELKPEGYVPVGKHFVSPWELVEGFKGGCNVVPWQELGGVRCDRKLLKMNERLCLSLRGNHTHDITPMEHEQVVIPNSPKPKTEQTPVGVVPQQFPPGYRPPMMAGGKPRMIRPMQPAHFNSLMGAPAPNVTITHQAAGFNPHEAGQFPPTQFDPVPSSTAAAAAAQFPPGNFANPQAYPGPAGIPPQFTASSQYPGNAPYPSNSAGFNPQAPGGFPPTQQFPGTAAQQFHQNQQMFETPPFIDSTGNQIVRSQFGPGPRMVAPPPGSSAQFMSEQQKRQFLEQQQKLRMAHPGMVFTQQAGPPPGYMNPQMQPPISTSMEQPVQPYSSQMAGQPQFIHPPMQRMPVPMSQMAKPMQSMGHRVPGPPQAHDQFTDQPSFFDQQFKL